MQRHVPGLQEKYSRTDNCIIKTNKFVKHLYLITKALLQRQLSIEVTKWQNLNNTKFMALNLLVANRLCNFALILENINTI